ncbi:MAG: hypothetical protein M1817_001491 [Caeruleum heppii]|nr:MAG: hypothetical protein M1817_001491 [Caeruleum heppii]
MSRPWQTTFDDNQTTSPLHPPNSLHGPGSSNVPPSFKTNVNRQKTKRWVEAKAMSYDGDDWGEVDEYDQYGAHEPVPPPAPKPTGRRQQGQGLSSTSPPPQNPMGGRSVTNPVYQEPEQFDQNHSRRVISAGGPAAQPGRGPVPQGMSSAATRDDHPPDSSHPTSPPLLNRTPMHVQTQGLGQPPQTTAFPAYEEIPAPGNGPPSNYPERRDFTSGAVPVALQSRPSPGPSMQVQGPGSVPAERFPPRKSSLSQQSPPVIPQPQPAEQPQPEGAPAPRERTASNPQKALPFIRPSDIYKRMNEERERERQSMESDRPSMDAINSLRPNATQPSEPTGIPANASRTDSPGRPLRRTPSMEGSDDADSNRRLKPMLDPVTERKSEYGYEGNALDDATRVYGPVGALTTDGPNPQSRESNGPEKPSLPNVNRVSGFGPDLWTTQQPTEATSNAPQPFSQAPSNTASQPDRLEPSSAMDSSLQHQPSLGFRSAVNQAFDPTTPISTSGSQNSHQGSGPSRSDSASTSGVSPIMSHVPSVNRGPPAIAEESHESADNTPHAGTPSDPTPSAQDSTEPLPRPFKPGHRRDLSTPSPNNSPKRSPVLEDHPQLPAGEAVEIRQPTPIEAPSATFSTRYDFAANSPAGPGTGAGTTAARPTDASPGFVPHHKNVSSASLQSRTDSVRSNSPTSVTGSPSRGKVKDLAGQFEAARSRSSSSHSSTRAGSASPARRVQEELGQPRPIATRDPSFRPPLPGGWVSYATTAGPSTPGSLGAGAQQTGTDDLGEEDPRTPTKASFHAETTPTNKKSGPANASEQRPGENPFQSVIDAGNALAGGIADAVGMNKSESPTPSESVSSIMTPSERQPQGSSLHPPQRPQGPGRNLSDSSSVPPTPPPKDTPLASANTGSDYFGPPAPLKHRLPGQTSSPHQPPTVTRPEVYPTLSTETSPQDLESDRLRKEIVKSLTPTAPDFRRTDTDESGEVMSPANDTRTISQRTDSGLLPSEYDSYWASPDAGASTSDSAPNEPNLASPSPSPSQQHTPVPQTLPTLTDPESSRQPSGTSPSARPGILQQRFSWEQDPESYTPTPMENESKELGAPSVMTPSAQTHQPGMSSSQEYPHAYESRESPAGAVSGAPAFNPEPSPGEVAELAVTPDREEPTAGTSDPSPIPAERQLPHIQGDESNRYATQDAEAAAGKRDHLSGDQGDGSERLPYEDKMPRQRDSSNEKEFMGDFGPGVPSTAAPPYSSGPAEDLDTTSKPPPPMKDVQLPTFIEAKTPAFREILALKTPAERIDAFNQTRERFAAMDTGLSQWIAITTAEIPEHADLPRTGWVGAGSATGRHKVAGGSGVKPPQQAYYQQYLNASSSPHAAEGGSPSQGAAGPSLGGPGGFSPGHGGSGKLTTQQVQARGKDLLHTAGVFGGKANVAAKGLFAKGKSRFRGAGGEKDESDIPTDEELESLGQPSFVPRSQTSSPMPLREDADAIGTTTGMADDGQRLEDDQEAQEAPSSIERPLSPANDHRFSEHSRDLSAQDSHGLNESTMAERDDRSGSRLEAGEETGFDLPSSAGVSPMVDHRDDVPTPHEARNDDSSTHTISGHQEEESVMMSASSMDVRDVTTESPSRAPEDSQPSDMPPSVMTDQQPIDDKQHIEHDDPAASAQESSTSEHRLPSASVDTERAESESGSAPEWIPAMPSPDLNYLLQAVSPSHERTDPDQESSMHDFGQDEQHQPHTLQQENPPQVPRQQQQSFRQEPLQQEHTQPEPHHQEPRTYPDTPADGVGPGRGEHALAKEADVTQNSVPEEATPNTASPSIPPDRQHPSRMAAFLQNRASQPERNTARQTPLRDISEEEEQDHLPSRPADSTAFPRSRIPIPDTSTLYRHPYAESPSSPDDPSPSEAGLSVITEEQTEESMSPVRRLSSFGAVQKPEGPSMPTQMPARGLGSGPGPSQPEQHGQQNLPPPRPIDPASASRMNVPHGPVAGAIPQGLPLDDPRRAGISHAVRYGEQQKPVLPPPPPQLYRAPLLPPRHAAEEEAPPPLPPRRVDGDHPAPALPPRDRAPAPAAPPLPPRKMAVEGARSNLPTTNLPRYDHLEGAPTTQQPASAHRDDFNRPLAQPQPIRRTMAQPQDRINEPRGSPDVSSRFDPSTSGPGEWLHPRQSQAEYEIAGVGPPVTDLSPQLARYRRTPGTFRRNAGVAGEDTRRYSQPPSTTNDASNDSMRPTSLGRRRSASTPDSTDEPDSRRRRSGFFGSLKRHSGNWSSPPDSRDGPAQTTNEPRPVAAEHSSRLGEVWQEPHFVQQQQQQPSQPPPPPPPQQQQQQQRPSTPLVQPLPTEATPQQPQFFEEPRAMSRQSWQMPKSSKRKLHKPPRPTTAGPDTPKKQRSRSFGSLFGRSQSAERPPKPQKRRSSVSPGPFSWAPLRVDPNREQRSASVQPGDGGREERVLRTVDSNATLRGHRVPDIGPPQPIEMVNGQAESPVSRQTHGAIAPGDTVSQITAQPSFEGDAPQIYAEPEDIGRPTYQGQPPPPDPDRHRAQMDVDDPPRGRQLHSPPLSGYYAPKDRKKKPRSYYDAAALHQRRAPYSPDDEDDASAIFTEVTPPPEYRPSRSVPRPVEPQYERQPIPAPYRSVSGDAGMLLTTDSLTNPYWRQADPRVSGQMNNQAGARGSEGADRQRPLPHRPAGTQSSYGFPRVTGSGEGGHGRSQHQGGHSHSQPNQVNGDYTPHGILSSPPPPRDMAGQQTPWTLSLPNEGALDDSSSSRSRSLRSTSGRPKRHVTRRTKSVQWASMGEQRSTPRGMDQQVMSPDSQMSPGTAQRMLKAGWVPSEVYYRVLAAKPLPPPPVPSKSPLKTHPFLPPSPVPDHQVPVHQGRGGHGMNGGTVPADYRTIPTSPSPDLTPRASPVSHQAAYHRPPSTTSTATYGAVFAPHQHGSFIPPAPPASLAPTTTTRTRSPPSHLSSQHGPSPIIPSKASSALASSPPERTINGMAGRERDLDRRSWGVSDSDKETVDTRYEDAEEQIVMSSTSYPGWEWRPSGVEEAWED